MPRPARSLIRKTRQAHTCQTSAQYHAVAESSAAVAKIAIGSACARNTLATIVLTATVHNVSHLQVLRAGTAKLLAPLLSRSLSLILGSWLSSAIFTLVLSDPADHLVAVTVITFRHHLYP